ncbi:MAG: RNA polymerase subunit sigma-24, partial [Anaerolineae bacterium]|nr:RNA polymerase subunit sigma-24 [Anaerolineae bacterium]
MPEQPSDDILIEQAKRGELESFNLLVLRYQDYCYSITYRIMGEPDGAADAAQDAFLTAYRKIRLFRSGNFKAWLARIATNTCYDELRKRKR